MASVRDMFTPFSISGQVLQSISAVQKSTRSPVPSNIRVTAPYFPNTQHAWISLRIQAASFHVCGAVCRNVTGIPTLLSDSGWSCLVGNLCIYCLDTLFSCICIVIEFLWPHEIDVHDISFKLVKRNSSRFSELPYCILLGSIIFTILSLESVSKLVSGNRTLPSGFRRPVDSNAMLTFIIRFILCTTRMPEE